MKSIKSKERDAIIQSLRAGVTPRVGQHHIQVGRAKEVEAMLLDIDRICEGGSTIRFVIGDYGSGKTFFLNLIRAIALEKKLVAVSADLNPHRRIHGTSGQARGLYAELMRNMSTRNKFHGGALPSVVERFVSEAVKESKAREIGVTTVISERLDTLSEMVGGFDFAQVIEAYWEGHDSGNDKLKGDALRWLRGEFTTKTDAKAALGVRVFINDDTFYDHLKLLAKFVCMAGYQGLMVSLDELVNLYKLTNTKARNSNYEQILRILNDCLQGSAESLGFLFGGTPEFLMDTRRGLYSYEALQSRLAENAFARDGLVDFTGPVLKLPNLSPEDFIVLLAKIRHVHAFGNKEDYLVPDSGLKNFMSHCHNKIGEAYFRTPRNTIKSFVNLLAVLEQNEETAWDDLVSGAEIHSEEILDLEPISEDDDIENSDELTTFKL